MKKQDTIDKHGCKHYNYDCKICNIEYELHGDRRYEQGKADTIKKVQEIIDGFDFESFMGIFLGGKINERVKDELKSKIADLQKKEKQ